MSTKIYKVFLFKTSAYGMSLSQEEQNQYLLKSNELRGKFGAKTIVTAFSYWSDEAWQYFGLEEFPSMEAVQQHSQAMMDIGWARGIEAKTYLGVSDRPVEPFTGKGGIVKLFFADFTEKGYQMDEAAYAKLGEEQGALQKKLGVSQIFWGDLISSESYAIFGMEHFPDAEAYLAFQKYLADTRRYRVIRSKIYLGIPG